MFAKSARPPLKMVLTTKFIMANPISEITKAVELDDISRLELLLAQNEGFCNAKYNKSSYDSLLHLAVSLENENSVIVLLANDANANAQNFDGEAPLHLSAQNGNLEITKYLITSGANPKVKNSRGLEPFELALEARNMDVVKFLRGVIYARRS